MEDQIKKEVLSKEKTKEKNPLKVAGIIIIVVSAAVFLFAVPNFHKALIGVAPTQGVKLPLACQIAILISLVGMLMGFLVFFLKEIVMTIKKR